ncbi:MAG: hypothetical protein Q7J48_04520 [Nocardioides sp.]|nr:hypothetical protein [Nocardioides sp.]
MTRERFSALPEPISLEETVTSHDVVDHPAEMADDYRETDWFLRSTAG